MNAEGYKHDPHYTEAESLWHGMQKSESLNQRNKDGDGWKLVDAFLSGGAPWGFTLRGGLEHREPLLITKVEEGSKAAAVSLQVGDELVNINEIPLSGYRQEAICLVKGSHKTLSLVVKRNMKMVDIVAQKMPSENDVHVARSFLTKILRSSMRRNEPISRPHSWHSTKFNDSQSETAKTQSPPTQIWHTRYDASSSSTDLSSGWEQTNLRRVSDQFSSLGSMDSLEHVSHPYPAGQLSPAKSNNSMEHLGGGKRDSAYSSFSTSSGTPDYTLSKSNTASTENVLHKVGQWDAPGKQNNGRNSQSLIEGVKLDDRVAYFQMPGVSCAGQQTEDSAGSRHSTSSRTSLGPVWHVPEKKKTASPSPPPPPPPPPARSDSFAATKVHERGLIIAHPEGPESYFPCKTSTENRRSHNPSLKNDSDGFHTSSDKSNHNQFSSNKQYSLSSSDVHQCQPYHQRNHSDKSTYSQPWAMSGPKPQNAAGYYSSMQELPTNGSSQHFGQNQRRNLSTSLTPTAADQNTDSSGQSRYYCVTPCQPAQHNLSGKSEDRKSITDLAQAGNERNSLCPQTVTQVKFHMPQQQQHSSHCKDSNGYSNHQVDIVLEPSVPKSSSDDIGSHKGPNAQNADTQFMSYPPSRPSEQRRSLPPQLRELPQDIRHHGQVSNKICPQATPMLHSLSMDAAGQEEKTRGLDSEESLESKQLRRSDRFATTLRNEIQIRRAKLQKSMSAATLTEGETEEDRDVWKSTESITPTSAGGSFTNSYKDNLKEAQARVLRATSFRRKDLEPVLLEHPAAEALPNYPSSALARKDVTPLPTVSESVMSKSGPGSGQVTRIGGRKRFPTEKKVRSFSEPDKIHQVGVKEDLLRNESSALDQQKLLKESGKPAFPNHVTPPCYTETRALSLSSTSETEVTMKSIRSREYTEEVQGGPYSAHKQFVLDQQRLGTFAEYEARWNIQKPPSETRASGRYRSADNILDPGPEERTKTPCFHERSRSSPSTDIYGQKIQVPARKLETEYSQTEIKPAELLNTATAFSDRGPGDCKVREKPVEFEHFSAPPTPPMHPGTNPDCRHRAAPTIVNHRPTSISHSLPESGLPQPEERSHTELPLSGQRRKPSALEKPPPPKCPEVDSHESFAGSQSEIFTHCSPTTDPNSAFVPTHSAKGDSEQGKGLVDKGQGALHHLSASNPQPASSPPASSFRPSGLATMEGKRAPSPQFSPQRLSDKPPVSLQDEDSNSVEHVIENQHSAVKKVPIRIVHSEEVTEKEKCPYLQHIDPPAVEAEGPGVTLLGSLGAAGQGSVFCAFTRQREPDSTPAPHIDPEPQRDAYITTVGAHIHSESQQPTDEPCSNGATVTRGLLEEQKREELARDIMGKDKSLADILDQSKMKTTMDLMEGIFPQGEQLLEGAHQRRKMPPKQPASRPAEDREKEDTMAAAVTMVTSSTYYSTSAPKAELLIKMKDMQEQEEEDSEDELDIDLANKKQELIDSLSKKLQVLREARESLQEDVLDNNALGDEVEVRVQQVCKPNELDKFRMFVGDLDKVVSLLLSLSGRLARVENALNSLEEDATAEERRTLMEKRKLLIRQHEDAKELKENLDRRERLVYDILAHHLPEDSLTDYEHFVKMKSALIIEQRKLEDKIKLGEEQLKCLTDSLPIEQRLALSTHLDP
ncbi:protein Shroom2 isoform X2 [Etheostoma cragini]|uniref:protein Shroom2 isoform X2 n=1 Tax=Etheostoma cragini TaxID=417921 RepID=UPI00155DE7CB|nr:protein Shroom2 isoform X2 [Etheostoma cragini]